MRKKTFFAIFAVLFTICLCACNVSSPSSMALAFATDTGENIKVELDTTGGYSLATPENGDFAVTKDDETILQGSFAVVDAWYYYYQGIQESENAELIENADGRMVWRYEAEDDNECDSAVVVSDKTAAVFGGMITDTVSEKTILEAMSRLTFSVAEEEH